MSTVAIPVHIALVDDTGQIGDAGMSRIAGALNQQIQADFAPVWHVRATVGAYPKEAVPRGQWAVLIQNTLNEPGALGYHTDVHNQPISYIKMTDDVSVTISHEVLEMLADPWGNRMHGARLPAGLEDDYGRFGLRSRTSGVRYLLEVSDPCEATNYPVAGIPLSDFLLPAWYRSSAIGQFMYSHVNGCTEPRQVADGGYVSFSNSQGEWFQVFNEGGSLQISDLGNFDKAAFGSVREWVDRLARQHRAGTR